MIEYVYEHDCPKDTGIDGCPVNGEQIIQRPTIMGSYYLMFTPRCAYTHAELRLVEVRR